MIDGVPVTSSPRRPLGVPRAGRRRYYPGQPDVGSTPRDTFGKRSARTLEVGCIHPNRGGGRAMAGLWRETGTGVTSNVCGTGGRACHGPVSVFMTIFISPQ